GLETGGGAPGRRAGDADRARGVQGGEVEFALLRGGAGRLVPQPPRLRPLCETGLLQGRGAGPGPAGGLDAEGRALFSYPRGRRPRRGAADRLGPPGQPAARGADVSEPAGRLIDDRIAELGDWRGETLARMRALIHEA